jgi:hypothetical protein
MVKAMRPNRKMFVGLLGALLLSGVGTACLADAVDDTQQQIEQDKQALRNYQKQLMQYEDMRYRVREYEAARPEMEQRFAEAKKGLKGKDLDNLMKTPGSELYVLKTWLDRESALKTNTERYIAALKGQIARQMAVIQQEQQAFDTAIASAARQQNQVRQAEQRVANQQRQEASTQYWQSKMFAPQAIQPDPAVVLGAGFLQGEGGRGSEAFSNWNRNDPKNATIWDSKKLKDQPKGPVNFTDMFESLQSR